MRHLRKYNESVSNSDISEYIKLVFSDLIEYDDDFEFDEGVSGYDNLQFAECNIVINIPTLHKVNKKLSGHHTISSITGDISKFVENSEKVLNIYKDIEVCINRVKDEYPNIRYMIQKHPNDTFNGEVLSYVDVTIEWGEHKGF